MGTITPSLSCAGCGRPLAPSRTGPCPDCGSTQKQLDMVDPAAPGPAEAASIHVVRREWRLRRLSPWRVAALAIAALVIGFFLAISLGVILGVALGIAVVVIALKTFTRTLAALRREIQGRG